jgi:plasmid stabilization system protein ParE
MRIEFHPPARLELREAYRWYYVRSPLAAAGFAREIDGALQRIAEAFDRYPEAEHGTRRFVVTRFPFTIVYRASEAVVTIVAVAHQRRSPGYWATR